MYVRVNKSNKLTPQDYFLQAWRQNINNETQSYVYKVY